MGWEIVIHKPVHFQRLHTLTLKGISLFKRLIADLRMD